MQYILMPVNATPEYYKAEERFQNAKSIDEKIVCLEEMIRLLPKHHGSENALAQLKAKLSKLRKESIKKSTRKGSSRLGVKKEGEAQVCILGFTNSGKSTLLKSITNAKPVISDYPFTTKKPEVGMMDYKGIKIQIIEIPSTFNPQFMSICRSADILMLLAKETKEEFHLISMLEDQFIRTKYILINTKYDTPEKVREKIWASLNLIVVYTKRGKQTSPMALPKGGTMRDFALRIHKDFIENFKFARVTRHGREIQAGLGYVLSDGDVVELHMG